MKNFLIFLQYQSDYSFILLYEVYFTCMMFIKLIHFLEFFRPVESAGFEVEVQLLVKTVHISTSDIAEKTINKVSSLVMLIIKDYNLKFLISVNLNIFSLTF